MINLSTCIKRHFRRKQKPILLKEMRPQFKEWRTQHPLPRRDELSLLDQHLADYATTVIDNWFKPEISKSKPLNCAVISSLPGIVATQEYAQEHQLDLMYFVGGEINRSFDEFYMRYFLVFDWLKQTYEQNPYDPYHFLEAVARYPNLDPNGFIYVEMVHGPKPFGMRGWGHWLYWDGKQITQLEGYNAYIFS